MSQLAMDTAATLAEHRSYPKLTAAQKRCINEVWDETIVPIFEENDALKAEIRSLRLEMQDRKDAAP